MLLRKALVLFILVFCNVYISSAQEIKPPPENKAVVYFARTSAWGLVINFSFYDSTRLLGKFNGNNYFRYECEPGYHLFWAKSENRDFVEANLEAGKIYFLEVLPIMGAVIAGVKIIPIDPSDEKKMGKILKFINKKSPVFVVSEASVTEGENHDEVIIRGLEKYKEIKARGKSITRLEKNG